MKRRYPLSRKPLRFSVMARSRHLAELRQTSEPMNRSLSDAAERSLLAARELPHMIHVRQSFSCAGFML